MKKGLFILIILAVAVTCNNPGQKQEQQEPETMEQQTTEPNTLTQAEIEEGWKLLFDGNTTEHWRGYNKDEFPEGWEVVDGTIHVIGSGRGEAGGGGDIITKEKYGNFELSLEWMVSEGGNSGIFYLAQEIPGEPIWKSSPEMQILDNINHPDAKLGIQGNRQAGALYDLIPAEPQTAKPAGEWNHVKILVYKGTVVHWMNGEQVLEYHLWTDDWKEMVANSKFSDYEEFVNTAQEGHIGLQDHGDDVWFRNIKILEMD
jgi:hypothetical protein